MQQRSCVKVSAMITAGTIVEALAKDGLGAALIASGIVVLFVTSEFLARRRQWQTEYTRKLTHLGAGVIVLCFPWLLHSTITVAVLAMAFGGLLLLGRWTGQLGSVHNVERRTSGAYFYPVAVFSLFWLSDGNPLLYCPSIAVLAISDTGAAIVGKSRGHNVYKVMDGIRSVEGSLAFFALTFGILVASLTIAGEPGWPEMLLVALVVSIVTTATEAVSVRGADNLFVPYACFLILERTLRLGLADLSHWFEGMIVTLAAVVMTWQRSGLTEAGGILVFVLGTLAWALGGMQWMLPLAFLYLFFVLFIPNDAPQNQAQDTDLHHVFPTTAAALIVLLAFGHFEDDSLFVPYLTTLSAGGALSMKKLARHHPWPVVSLILLGAMAPLLPVAVQTPEPLLVGVLILSIASVIPFEILKRTPFVGRRLLAALLCGAIAWQLLTG